MFTIRFYLNQFQSTLLVTDSTISTEKLCVQSKGNTLNNIYFKKRETKIKITFIFTRPTIDIDQGHKIYKC